MCGDICYKYITQTKIHGSKENPTNKTIVDSTDITISTCQATNHAVTHEDLDILVQNLTIPFSKQIRAIINTHNVAPQQQALADIANQIKRLQARLEPREDVFTRHKSNDGETKTSDFN